MLAPHRAMVLRAGSAETAEGQSPALGTSPQGPRAHRYRSHHRWGGCWGQVSCPTLRARELGLLAWVSPTLHACGRPAGRQGWDELRGDSTKHSALSSSALSKCKKLGPVLPLNTPTPFLSSLHPAQTRTRLTDGTSCSTGHRGFFQELERCLSGPLPGACPRGFHHASSSGWCLLDANRPKGHQVTNMRTKRQEGTREKSVPSARNLGDPCAVTGWDAGGLLAGQGQQHRESPDTQLRLPAWQSGRFLFRRGPKTNLQGQAQHAVAGKAPSSPTNTFLLQPHLLQAGLASGSGRLSAHSPATAAAHSPTACWHRGAQCPSECVLL